VTSSSNGLGLVLGEQAEFGVAGARAGPEDLLHAAIEDVEGHRIDLHAARIREAARARR
jgi:hypothetical protein